MRSPQVESLLSGLSDQVCILYCGRPLVADLGLCLINIFFQTLGVVEGSHVKCADLLGLAEGAYTSK